MPIFSPIAVHTPKTCHSIKSFILYILQNYIKKKNRNRIVYKNKFKVPKLITRKTEMINIFLTIKFNTNVKKITLPKKYLMYYKFMINRF